MAQILGKIAPNVPVYNQWEADGKFASDADVVHKTGDETIAGGKTFSNSLSAPYFSATFNNNIAKFYTGQMYFSADGRENYLYYPDGMQSDYPNTKYNNFDVLATRDYVKWVA